MNESEVGDKTLTGYYDTTNYVDGSHTYVAEYDRGLEYGPNHLKQTTKRNLLPELDGGETTTSNKTAEKIDNFEKQNVVSILLA